MITFDGLNDTFLAGNTDGGVFIPNRKYYQNQLVEAFVNEVGGSPTFRDWARTTFLTFFHPDRYYAGRLAKGPLKKMWRMMQGEAEASQVGSGKGVRFEADRLQYYGANLVSIMGIARAREIYSMHFFQPNLVYRKDKLSKEEESILSGQDRSTVIEKRKFWESADKMFRELNKKYREIPKTKFQSLADLFRDEAGQVYVDPGHYNDRGNQVIAERIAQEIWGLVRW